MTLSLRNAAADDARQSRILALAEAHERIADYIAGEMSDLADVGLWSSGCIGPTLHAQAVLEDARSAARAALVALAGSRRANVCQWVLDEAVG